MMRKKKQQIPESIVQNGALNDAIAAALPSNYKFEIHKTLWRMQQLQEERQQQRQKAVEVEEATEARRVEDVLRVALQFPEGLLMYACVIADILERFSPAGPTKVLVLGDVTYGACCVDDFTAGKLGAHLLVHYGHSCLVPTTHTSIPCLYVFVEISFEMTHVVECIATNFSTETRLAVLGTIQFAAAVHQVRQELVEKRGFPEQNVLVPQAKPLSPGEVLGCTSPQLTEAQVEVVIFLADGRFHMESVMIHNPGVRVFLYNPYSRTLSAESYDHEALHRVRSETIGRARSAQRFGVVLGTLGRQGNPALLQRVKSLLRRSGKPFIVVLLSEVFPSKLALFSAVDAWVEIACPRLAMDWGASFDKPLLTPYELEVALGETEWREVYPMDYYASSGGDWSNRYIVQRTRPRRARRAQPVASVAGSTTADTDTKGAQLPAAEPTVPPTPPASEETKSSTETMP